MSTVASLQSELKNLSSQSRRRNTELTTSSDKSLAILDAVNQSYSSDREAISSLRKYPEFVTPFVLACSEASAKSCASALQCVQNLATYRGIAPSKLHELLAALMEATQLGLGIQLKILQVLPVILYEFAADLSGELIVELLQVCAQLLSNNKVAMVHNAAYATLQQLVTGIFDRVSIDENNSPDETVTIDAAEPITFTTPPHLHDAAMVLLDLCDIAEKQPPRFIKIRELPLTFTLELIELTLTNQASLIHRYEELSTILRSRVTPLLLRLFSETAEFPIVLRVTRIFYLLLRQHLDIVTTGSEVILSTFSQSASQGPQWKRALCLEVLQGIFLEVNLVLELFSRFDGEGGRTDIMRTIVSAFADMLSEKSGLQLASELTPEDFDRTMSTEMSSAQPETASVTSLANPDSTQEAPHTQGIVLGRQAMIKQPVIDMLDRVEPPRVPNGYTYLLVLKSINSLADDIHKVATVHEQVQGLARKLSTPLLKCFSVALGAAMDLDLYRSVVRSVQRLAHSSGILMLREPRDEYIVLLNQYSYLPEDLELRQRLLGRITLCVRALFNLGYALGNQLGQSWSLVTDAITHLYFQVGGYASSEQNLLGSNDPDYRVMSAALRKLIDGTLNLSDDAVISFMAALGDGDETIHFTLLEELANVNAGRFADPETKCWASLSQILLQHLLSKGQNIAANVLNRSSIRVMSVGSSDLPDANDHDGSTFDEQSQKIELRAQRAHAMIIHSICQEMECNVLDVRVHAIENLNTLLDKFGAKLRAGWEEIFSVVSPVPATGELDLMRSAFRTLELICSDFLDNIPYSCVFSLTLCLDEFSRQTEDLNTSFTSTSLFWGVCDHLMSGDNLGPDMADTQTITNEKLVALARDDSCPSKRFALWLLAVIKLANIAQTVPQHQVWTSAVQIFLRLFSTHGHKLPLGVWDLAHKLAFPALLNSRSSLKAVESKTERQEMLCLLVEGVTRIYVTFMNTFEKLDDFVGFARSWVDFLDSCVPESPKVSLVCYKSLHSIMSADGADRFPRNYVWTFWTSQNRAPSDGSLHPKSTADSLMALVELYPMLRSSGPVKEAIKLLTDCACFPYYRAGGSQSLTMSPLQQSCTDMLGRIDAHQDTEVMSLFLGSLGTMALTPYEEPTAGNPNFVGLSDWAQLTLRVTIISLKERSVTLSTTILRLLTDMSKIIRLGGSKPEPINVFLLLLDISPDIGHDEEKTVIEVGQLILAEESQTTAFMERFVSLVRAKNLALSGWREILSAVLLHSVIYERSTLNLKFYQKHDCAVDLGLEYGTVESPKVLPRSKVAYYCIDLLRRLAIAKEDFAEIARDLYEFRVVSVLSQYIGDSKILGAEPIRIVLRDELLFILRLLRDDIPNNLRSCKIIDLLIAMLPRADKVVLPYVKDIIKNAYIVS